ncbi:MAG: ribosome silencing factor [Pseudomonadota bacterium]
MSASTNVASKAADKAKTAALDTILHSLDESKAEEVTTIDITGKSAVADHMVVANGRVHRHVNAITDRLLRDLKDAGHGTPKVEGVPANDWVLVDTGDVIVHVFRPEVREFYNLEKLWNAIAAGDGESEGEDV